MTTFTHISVDDVANFQGDVAIVDIRDPQSFANGHMPNASPLNNDNFAAFIEQTPKDKPVVVVCYHGVSSQQAAQVIAATSRSKSSGVPTFNFRIGRWAFCAATRVMFSTVSSESVNAVWTGFGFGNFANCHTRLFVSLAFKSQIAQSNALRAAPAGSVSINSMRVMFGGTDCSCSITLSTVSPYRA